MGPRTIKTLLQGLLLCSCACPLVAQDSIPRVDSTRQERPAYDPFGPTNLPDHTGQGSGGVLTPSPYENIMQTYFTRVNADYYGVQYMLDSPFQIAAGVGWTAYQANVSGILLKVRTTGFRERRTDPLRSEGVPYYLLSAEGSLDYPFLEHQPRAFKIRAHLLTESEGLSMPGVGVQVSRGNFLLAADRPMDRRLELEVTWIQVGGGYVMPLSPRKGGVNLAVCGAMELLGMRYQTFYSDVGQFTGAKIASLGWMASVGWNVNALVNLAAYLGTEWNYAMGGLRVPADRFVFSDIGRTTITIGLQATGRWFNIVSGLQKEWEHTDFHGTEHTERAIRSYLGASLYFRR